MSGKCRDSEIFPVIPEQFRFKAHIYDHHDDAEEESVVVDVKMIDYETGSIWYGNGFRSTNYKLIPATAPTNEPLTLEELRGMDGEPLKHWVWIEFITRPEKSGYMRSHSDFTGGKCFCCEWPGVGYTLEYEEYGETWLAYRRKPGGSEK